MGETVVLEIRVENIVKEITFPNIRVLDELTVNYKNKDEFFKALCPDIDKRPDFIIVKYTYKKRVPKNKDQTEEEKPKYITNTMSVKYADDDFDEEDLKIKLTSYLYSNPKAKFDPSWKVIYIIDGQRRKTHKEGYITVPELEYAIQKLFEQGYKVKRDLYFKLKKEKIKVKCKSTRKGFKPSNRLNEYIMNEGDSWGEYLQQLSSRGKEYEEIAEEEMHLRDLSEMPRRSVINNHPYVDGVPVTKEEFIEFNPEDNLKVLQEKINSLPPQYRESTQKVIESLNAIFPSRGGKRRCKR